MKCPSCKKSLGVFGNAAKASSNKEKDTCPHCDKRFKLGYPRFLVAILAAPLLLLSFFVFSSALAHILAAGLSFGIATALAIRAEPLEEPSGAPIEGQPKAPAADLDGLGICPNCNSEILMRSRQCRKCKAQFGPNSTWQVRPLPKPQRPN